MFIGRSIRRSKRFRGISSVGKPILTIIDCQCLNSIPMPVPYLCLPVPTFWHNLSHFITQFAVSVRFEIGFCTNRTAIEEHIGSDVQSLTHVMFFSSLKDFLLGDASKARSELKWKPKTTFLVIYFSLFRIYIQSLPEVVNLIDLFSLNYLNIIIRFLRFALRFVYNRFQSL